MKKTIVFSILSALLLFIPVGARASTMGGWSATQVTTYPVYNGVTSPVTFNLDFTNMGGLPAGDQFQYYESNFSNWWINTPSTLPSGCTYDQQSDITTRFSCDHVITTISVTRDITATGNFSWVGRVLPNGGSSPYDTETHAITVVAPATPTPTPVGGTTAVMNNFGQSMKIAAINYLAGVSLPIAFVGLVSIVLLFAVIRWFRSILHI